MCHLATLAMVMRCQLLACCPGWYRELLQGSRGALTTPLNSDIVQGANAIYEAMKPGERPSGRLYPRHPLLCGEDALGVHVRSQWVSRGQSVRLRR